MDLLEHEGKAILARHGIRVPAGDLARNPNAAAAVTARLGGRAVLKAQLARGGRGKSGLVRVAGDPEAAARAAAELFADEQHDIDLLRIEAHIDLARELYFAIRVDDVAGAPRALASVHGGVDVETQAGDLQTCLIDVREGLHRHRAVELWRRAGLMGETLQQAADAALATWQAFLAADAQLVEINPLGVDVDGRCWALDAKVSVDDNALGRHPEWPRRAGGAAASDRERRAARLGINAYMEFAGDVALITTGASFSMLALDLLRDLGVAPANFMDMGGQSSGLAREKMIELVARRVERDPGIRAILIGLVQTSRPLQLVLDPIKGGFGGRPLPCPVFCWIGAGLVATESLRLEEGLAQLEAIGITTFLDFGPAVEAAVKVVRR